MLEGRCAFEAVKRAKRADVDALKAIHDSLERNASEDKIEAFFEANQQFHLKIQELSGNRWLLSVIQDLRKVLKLSRMHSLSLEGRIQQSLSEHRAIMAAILSGHPDKAEKAMHDHLLSGREALARIEESTSAKAA